MIRTALPQAEQDSIQVLNIRLMRCAWFFAAGLSEHPLLASVEAMNGAARLSAYGGDH